jgi:hypothetical protein
LVSTVVALSLASWMAFTGRSCNCRTTGATRPRRAAAKRSM